MSGTVFADTNVFARKFDQKNIARSPFTIERDQRRVRWKGAASCQPISQVIHRDHVEPLLQVGELPVKLPRGCTDIGFERIESRPGGISGWCGRDQRLVEKRIWLPWLIVTRKLCILIS